LRLDDLAREHLDTGLGQTLTAIETKILDFMVQYLRTNTYQPSIREIGERFGIKSTKTVSEHLQALADKGFLERDPSRSRGVKILGMDLSAQTVSVSSYDTLPSGPGALPRTPEASYSIDRRIAGPAGSFFVRAKADELAAINVNEGDLLLIEPTRITDLGQDSIVAANITGEAGYYRFSRNGRAAFLTALGGGAPTAVEDPDTIRLIGRVAGLFRQTVGVPALVSTIAH
jgi:repressor LexA